MPTAPAPGSREECIDLEALEDLVRKGPSGEHDSRFEHLTRCSPCRRRAAEIASCLGVEDVLSGREPPPPSVPPPPTGRFGSYRILSELGRGGMGVVHLAYQENPPRKVALKLIHPGRASGEAMRRFQYEVEVLARLEHPGCARIYDAGLADTEQGVQPFYAMELVEGQTITDHVNGERTSLAGKLELIARLADAVHHAHQRGVIHRDLKPANILVDAEGSPKILDFGVARAIEPDEELTSTDTQPGRIVGTLPYMSPEQARGAAAELDTRSDLYTLGVVAYEMLSGRIPYDLQGTSLPGAVRIICEEPPRPLAGIPRDVETVIGKALEKDPERRYASAADFAADVRRYLRREPIAARRATILYRVGLRIRRNPALSLAILLLIVAVPGALGWLYRQSYLLAEERGLRLAKIYREREASEHEAEGHHHLRRGRRPEALRSFTAAIEADPSSPDRYLYRAEARLPTSYKLSQNLELVRVSVADCLEAHETAGGDPVRDPSTGRILLPPELDEMPIGSDGSLEDLPDIRRIKPGIYERISRDGNTERVGGPGMPRALLLAGFLLLQALRDEESLIYFERAATAGASDLHAEIAQAALHALRFERREALALLEPLSRHPEGEENEAVWSFLAQVLSTSILAEGETENPFASPERAERAWRRALDLHPGNPAYLNNLAAELRQLGRDEEAIPCYEEVTRIAPDEITGWQNLGKIYEEKQRYPRAREVYVRACTLARENAGQEDLGQVPQELQWRLVTVLTALGERESTYEAAEEAIRRFPGSAGFWILYVSACLELDDREAALEVARRAIEAWPTNGRLWQQYGEQLAAHGSFKKAEGALRRSAELNNALAASLALADLHLRRGKIRSAEAWLGQAEHRNRNHPDVVLCRARVLVGRDRRPEAREILSRLAQSTPTSKSSWIRICQGIEENGFPALARQAYEHGRNHPPPDDTDDIALAEVRFLLQGQDPDARDPAYALEILESTLLRYPSFVEIAELHGLALLRLGRHSEAADAIQRAHELRGPSPRANLEILRSLVHFHLGQRNLALSSYHRALFLVGESLPTAQVEEHLAEARSLLGIED